MKNYRLKNTRRSRPVVKFFRNLAIAILVLLLLLIGAGLVYTWYIGLHPPVATQQKTVPEPATPTIKKPNKPLPDAKIGASIQYLSSPAAPGSNSSVTVRTNAEAKCTITVVYDKTPSTDSGLAQKVADEFGMVTWTWTVPSTAPTGKWPVTVTCANQKYSAVVKGDLEVKTQ